MIYVPLATLMPPASIAHVAPAILAGPAAMTGFHAVGLRYDLDVRFRTGRPRAG